MALTILNNIAALAAENQLNITNNSLNTTLEPVSYTHLAIALSRALKDGRKRSSAVRPVRNPLQHRAAKLYHAFEDVLGAFANDNFFATRCV